MEMVWIGIGIGTGSGIGIGIDNSIISDTILYSCNHKAEYLFIIRAIIAFLTLFHVSTWAHQKSVLCV